MVVEHGERKRLAIIDGKSVFYRGYYAMPSLSTKDGTPTGGVYGFAVMALEVIKRLRPDYVAVAWDKSKTNIRKRLEIYPEYKAGRKPAPPDFKVQIPILHELLEAFGWPLYEMDDYEADDIMGALAVQARTKDIETMLITSDLDALQLINGHVQVYALKKGLSNIELFHPKSFTAKYGLDPSQFLDLKSLMGDSSDNIPGVPGIGEKGAIELLKQYKNLDGVYDNLVLIKESIRKKLEAGKDLAYMSKKLAAIWTDAPIKLNLKEVDGRQCDPVKVRDILQQLEFKTLVRQLPEAMKVVGATVPDDSKQSLWVSDASPGTVIDSEHGLQKLESLNKAANTVIYTRAAGRHGRNPSLLILSPDPKQTYILDLKKISKESLAKYHQIIAASPLVGHDVKSSIEMLIELGMPKPSVSHDVLVGAFLINSLRREQTLTELASADIGYDGSQFEDLSDEELVDRASEITSVIRALANQQINELKKLPKVEQLAHDIDWPVIPVIAAMEHTGITLDTKHLHKMSRRLDDEISDVEQLIYGHADQEFNIGSPGQLADILFNKLQLPTQGIKKGKTGYSTAASELDKLRPVHPIIDLITQYRELAKLKNTYVDTLPTMVDENSKLHTTYSLTVAQTGRLSSNDPNLQNIPVRTELGREIRTAFVADPGNVLVSADYSQFELRLAAYLCDDDDLIEMFNRDVDVHTATAAEIYGRNPEEVTKTMRRDAKVVNFGIMYGLSAHGLVQATGMTHDQAKHFIDRYFEVRPKLLGYIESVKKQAFEQGYVETIFGRRRPTPDVHSSNFMVREAAMRAAVNMPFQGSAADIMKLAMIAVADKLEKTSCKLLLQIHDSILVECPKSEAENTAKLLKSTMEDVHKLPVKLTVDTSIGQNWGEL